MDRPIVTLVALGNVLIDRLVRRVRCAGELCLRNPAYGIRFERFCRVRCAIELCSRDPAYSFLIVVIV